MIGKSIDEKSAKVAVALEAKCIFFNFAVIMMAIFLGVIIMSLITIFISQHIIIIYPGIYIYVV